MLRQCSDGRLVMLIAWAPIFLERAQQRALLACAALLMASSGCVSGVDTGAVRSGGLAVSLRSHDAGRLTVEVRLVNGGSTPIAVADYYGSHTRWIRLEIEEVETGTLLQWPEIQVWDLPPYDCLQPGQEISAALDLELWQIRLRGRVIDPEAWAPMYAAGKYRVRARYTDWGSHGKRSCPSFSGEVSSDWLQFEVPPP
jgi:hypothetical protein